MGNDRLLLLKDDLGAVHSCLFHHTKLETLDIVYLTFLFISRLFSRMLLNFPKYHYNGVTDISDLELQNKRYIFHDFLNLGKYLLCLERKFIFLFNFIIRSKKSNLSKDVIFRASNFMWDKLPCAEMCTYLDTLGSKINLLAIITQYHLLTVMARLLQANMLFGNILLHQCLPSP